MDPTLATTFWGVSLLFALTPGADWAYAISSGLRRGGAVPAVAGMLSGHVTVVAVVAAGVAAVLAASGPAMALLSAAGAAYLIWLGITALRHPATTGPDVAASPVSRGKTFAKGAGISVLNPKVFLLILALLPQFASESAPWPMGLQMLALGALHVGNSAVVYFSVSLGAGRVLARRPRAAQMVGVLCGVVMLLLGGGILVEQAVSLVA